MIQLEVDIEHVSYTDFDNDKEKKEREEIHVEFLVKENIKTKGEDEENYDNSFLGNYIQNKSNNKKTLQ